MLWTEEILTSLANRLGTFVQSDKNSLFGTEKKVTRVMVELDLNKGLPTEIDIVWGKTSFRQCLEYHGLPFRCFKCQHTGHTMASFPLLLHSGVDSMHLTLWLTWAFLLSPLA